MESFALPIAMASDGSGEVMVLWSVATADGARTVASTVTGGCSSDSILSRQFSDGGGLLRVGERWWAAINVDGSLGMTSIDNPGDVMRVGKATRSDVRMSQSGDTVLLVYQDMEFVPRAYLLGADDLAIQATLAGLDGSVDGLLTEYGIVIAHDDRVTWYDRGFNELGAVSIAGSALDPRIQYSENEQDGGFVVAWWENGPTKTVWRARMSVDGAISERVQVGEGVRPRLTTGRGIVGMAWEASLSLDGYCAGPIVLAMFGPDRRETFAARSAGSASVGLSVNGSDLFVSVPNMMWADDQPQNVLWAACSQAEVLKISGMDGVTTTEWVASSSDGIP